MDGTRVVLRSSWFLFTVDDPGTGVQRILDRPPFFYTVFLIINGFDTV